MPLKLRADPDTDIFRKLLPDEIPPAINSLKSSSSLLVLLADRLEPDIKRATQMLLRSLGVKQYKIVQESSLDPNDLREKDILMVGYPNRKELIVKLPGQVASKTESFTNRHIFRRIPPSAPQRPGDSIVSAFVGVACGRSRSQGDPLRKIQLLSISKRHKS